MVGAGSDLGTYVPSGIGNNTMTDGYFSIGQTGGEQMHKLLLSEMPSHNHWQGADMTPWAASTSALGMSGSDPRGGSFGTSYAGGDQAHNNMPPYYALAYILKT